MASAHASCPGLGMTALDGMPTLVGNPSREWLYRGRLDRGLVPATRFRLICRSHRDEFRSTEGTAAAGSLVIGRGRG